MTLPGMAGRTQCEPALSWNRHPSGLAGQEEPSMRPIVQPSRINRRAVLSALAVLTAASGSLHAASARAQGVAPVDPLASWNDGATKQALTDFVDRVTRAGGPDFVSPAERIAVFDNDGTLWAEHPMYFQLAFALDRVKAMAPLHPEWTDTQPFKAALDGDMKTLAGLGDRGAMEVLTATHAGMTTAEF